MKKRDVIKLLLAIIEIAAIFATTLWILGLFASLGMAEDGVWVLCQPGNGKPNEVMIREKPGRKSAVVGAVSCGDYLATDGKTRGRWIHVIDLASETGEGWISAGYVVTDQPYHIDADGVIRCKGRVACRDSLDGKRIGWAQPGDMVTVYWISEDWAVTDRGYISTRYVEVP